MPYKADLDDEKVYLYQDGGFDEQSAAVCRAVAARAKWEPLERRWSYPRSPGAILGLIEAVALMQVECERSDAFNEAAAPLEKLTDYEHSLRRIMQAYMNDVDKPLPTYTTLTSPPPWRHQSIAWHWAMRTEVLYLAHKPGLGKTREAADIIRGAYEQGIIQPMRQIVVPRLDEETPARLAVAGGALVLCPNVVLGTWAEEIKKYQNLGCSILWARAVASKWKRSAEISWAHVAPYSMLPYLQNNRYDLLVCDEAHLLAHGDTNRFEQLLALRQHIRRVLFMSGTPVSNRLPSLWAQYFALDGGRTLGACEHAFKERYFEEGYKPKEGALEAITQRCSRVTYFLRKGDALPWMPQKLPLQAVYVPMFAKQKEYYESVRQKAKAEILAGKVSVANSQAKIMKQLQILQGHVRDDDGRDLVFDNGKLQALADMITGDGDLADRKTIVWCRFTADIHKIADMLAAKGIPYLVLSGEVTGKDREAVRDAWNTDTRYRVLIGMITVGIGVNLHAPHCVNAQGNPDRCSTTIYYGIDYSPVNLEQSMDRTHRGDQVEECLYRFLLTEPFMSGDEEIEPMDVRIYKALQEKMETAEETFTEGGDYYRRLLVT